jgi:hypothetical protein
MNTTFEIKAELRFGRHRTADKAIKQSNKSFQENK